MISDLVPVDVTLLGEGEFIDDIQGQFDAAKQALLAHVAEHGHKIKKANASVSVEIEISYEDHDGCGTYNIRTQVKHKQPAPPARGSRVNRLVGDNGEIDLFCQTSGSREDSPMQGRLAQTDGTGIDPETGLPSEELTLRIGKQSVA